MGDKAIIVTGNKIGMTADFKAANECAVIPNEFCTNCREIYTVTISGFSSECAIYNGTYVLFKNGDCEWEYTNGSKLRAVLTSGCLSGYGCSMAFALYVALPALTHLAFSKITNGYCPEVGSYVVSGGYYPCYQSGRSLVIS